MSFSNRIKNHPTVQMFRLLVGLEPYKNYQNSETENPASGLLGRPLVLLLILVVSLFLITAFFTAKSSDSNQVSSPALAEPLVDPSEKSTLNPLVTPNTRISDLSVGEENNLLATEISKISTKANTVQINSKRIEKLEMLLIQEQKKNKELYSKLNTQDVQLQELQAIAIKDVKISPNDQKYITAITENENTAILDKTKFSKIDYYNKVRVLLKNELSSQGRNSIQNTQLQSLVNKLFSDNKSSKVINVDNKYKTSLAQESAVRNNEVRSIVLKKNETLWGLAQRAYGDGMLYKKIIKANPHINEGNARFLRPGILIRIPK